VGPGGGLIMNQMRDIGEKGEEIFNVTYLCLRQRSIWTCCAPRQEAQQLCTAQ